MTTLKEKYCKVCFDKWAEYVAGSMKFTGLLASYGEPFDDFCEDCKKVYSKLDEALMTDTMTKGLILEAIMTQKGEHNGKQSQD